MRQIQFHFEMRESQDLQVVRYFGQLSLSIFIYYIHNKDVHIFIHSAKISHYLRVLWLSHSKLELDLDNNLLTGKLPTEMRNLNELGKFFCIHCLNYSLVFVFFMIICISLLWIYQFNMESVNWKKYLTTCKLFVSFYSVLVSGQ